MSGNELSPEEAADTGGTDATPPQPSGWQPAQFSGTQHWDSYLQLTVQPVFLKGFEDPTSLDTAVRMATLYLETRIRQLCDAPLTLYGTRLIDLAFSAGNPRGQLLSDDMVGGEAAGIHSLFAGAVLHIRNPLGHRDVNLRPPEAFESISFVSYLLRVANEAALARYVYPFVPSAEKFRGIQSTKWADVDNDGSNEFIVLVGERNYGASTAGHGRVLVLTNNFSDSLPGDLPLLENAYYSAHIAVGDLDGDGTVELLASFAHEGTMWRNGMVVDWDGVSLRAVSTLDDSAPLRSHRWPFEIIKPMQHKPALIACYDEANAVSYVAYAGGTLSRKEIVI